jgi:hypothetical protein
MNQFIIKAAKPKDRFYIEEASDYIYLVCSGYADLRKTIRCVTPQGVRVRSPCWFSGHLKRGPLILEHPLFRTLMFEIRPLKQKAEPKQEVDYTNRFGFAHRLKIVTQELWTLAEKTNIKTI